MLGIYIYGAAILAQLLATLYAANLYRKAKTYRLACGFLVLALVLMLGRRITPIYDLIQTQGFNLFDAWLSLAISFFLLLGVFHVQEAWKTLEYKNFLLDHGLKTDSLTGALSRMETFCRAELEIQRSFRTKKPLTFLMVDIDRFKNINDWFGHPLGDVVLLNLAKICREQMRVVDIFGRVGGEEFMAILPETDAEQAYEIAERLRKRIAATSCGCFELPNDKNGDKHDIRITVSVGLATFSPANDHQTQATLVLKKYYDLCDKAMYRAKQLGRNQVSV